MYGMIQRYGREISILNGTEAKELARSFPQVYDYLHPEGKSPRITYQAAITADQNPRGILVILFTKHLLIDRETVVFLEAVHVDAEGMVMNEREVWNKQYRLIDTVYSPGQTVWDYFDFIDHHCPDCGRWVENKEDDGLHECDECGTFFPLFEKPKEIKPENAVLPFADWCKALGHDYYRATDGLRKVYNAYVKEVALTSLSELVERVIPEPEMASTAKLLLNERDLHENEVRDLMTYMFGSAIQGQFADNRNDAKELFSIALNCYYRIVSE